MYTFAIVALLGLGAVSLMLLAERFLHWAVELRAAVLVFLGVGAAWLANFNMWADWGLSARRDWIGITLTGLAIAGFAYLWHVVLSVVAGVTRKIDDEAETLEREQIRRVA